MVSNQLVHATENKYNRLLSVLSLLLLSVGLPERYSLTKAIGFMLCMGAMLLIVRQITPNRQLIRFYSVLITTSVLLIVLQILGLLSLKSYDLAQIAGKSGLLIILGIPILLIQRETFLAHSVTGDTLKGGISVYLLLGLLWAMIYNLIYFFDHDAFGGVALNKNQGDLLHFSFTTLTTVGYGDIHPITAIAKAAADLEAVIGVLYPSILIARLVSLYETTSKEVL